MSRSTYSHGWADLPRSLQNPAGNLSIEDSVNYIISAASRHSGPPIRPLSPSIPSAPPPSTSDYMSSAPLPAATVWSSAPRLACKGTVLQLGEMLRCQAESWGPTSRGRWKVLRPSSQLCVRCRQRPRTNTPLQRAFLARLPVLLPRPESLALSGARNPNPRTRSGSSRRPRPTYRRGSRRLRTRADGRRSRRASSSVARRSSSMSRCRRSRRATRRSWTVRAAPALAARCARGGAA